MALERYREKRNFKATLEPRGGAIRKRIKDLKYLIHKHAARQLHYDLRLELNSVLLSWAVPKGPSLDPAEKWLALHVEDHALEYGSFEGTIPTRQYGGGTVNNAARQFLKDSILDISTAQFDETFKTNIYANLWITSAAVAHLKPGSTIINTASVNAYEPDG